MDDFAALRAEIHARGLDERQPVRVIAEFAAHFVFALGGLVLLVSVESTLLKGVALLVSTLGLLGISTSTHTSDHGATSASMRLNQFLGLLGYPFMLQVSLAYWHNKHVVVHHPSPNVVGVDDDVDLRPWLALTERDYEVAPRWLRRWYDIQWIGFPVLLFFNGITSQFRSWRFLLAILRDPAQRRPRHWVDLVAMVLHIAVWILLPMLWWTPGDVLTVYVLRIGLMSYAMFVAFAPAHYPALAEAVEASQDSEDFALLQAVNTINFDGGWYGRFLCSGVDYQIEHHLFPSVSHTQYPKIAPLVRTYCARQGYPYRTMSWGRAIYESVVIFRVRKTVHPRLEDFRLPAAVAE